MKKRIAKLLVALILSMTMLMGMCMSTMAAWSTPYPANYVRVWDSKLELYATDGLTLLSVLNEGDVISAGTAIFSYSGYGLYSYLDNELIPTSWYSGDVDCFFLPKAARVVSIEITGKESGIIKFETIPEPKSEPGHTHSYSWKTLLAPTTEQDGVEALACTICGDLKATQPISATGYALELNAQVIDLAGSGAPVVVDLGRYNVLPRWFVKKLVERDDLNITLKITYNHQNYVLEVPKTATIEDESIEWYGPLKLLSMFPQK